MTTPDDPGLMAPLDALLLALFRDDRTDEERQRDQEMVKRIVERAQKWEPLPAVPCIYCKHPHLAGKKCSTPTCECWGPDAR